MNDTQCSHYLFALDDTERTVLIDALQEMELQHRNIALEYRIHGALERAHCTPGGRRLYRAPEVAPPGHPSCCL